MGTSIVRYNTSDYSTPSWGVLNNSTINPLSIDSNHHRDVMNMYYSDRAAFDAAIGATAIDESSVEYLSPVVQDIQLIVQGMNYASHRAEGGVFNKDNKPKEEDENLIFYKASSTISKPNETILRPKNVHLLDFEIELGFVMKKPITEAVTITDDNLGDYVGGVILANDVSARDAMFGAPAMQWFKGKSQRTFCPLGPVLYLLEGDDIKQIYSFQLTLKLNGKVRQDAVTDQLIHKPPKTLTEISQFTNLNVGDCILTGTPGGVLMNLNLKTALAIILNMKNDFKRRQKLTEAQQARENFLKPGDVLELEIKSVDGSINLGKQRNEIADA
jgi:2-keto-4-pentenoate hydratase/2-oxohepta-3-ene-1,7-dioic acid hydratase in catechol pathway